MLPQSGTTQDKRPCCFREGRSNWTVFLLTNMQYCCLFQIKPDLDPPVTPNHLSRAKWEAMGGPINGKPRSVNPGWLCGHGLAPGNRGSPMNIAVPSDPNFAGKSDVV